MSRWIKFKNIRIPLTIVTLVAFTICSGIQFNSPSFTAFGDIFTVLARLCLIYFLYIVAGRLLVRDQKVSITVEKRITLIILVGVIFLFVSEVINNEVSDYRYKLLDVFLLFILLMLSDERQLNSLVICVLISPLPFVFRYSLNVGYWNTFANSVAATIFLIVFYISYTRGVKNYLFYGIAIILSFIVIFPLHSRNALIAVLVACLILLFHSLKKVRGINNKVIISFVLLVITAVALYVNYDSLYSFFINKWGNTRGMYAQVFRGMRGEVWTYVLRHINFFGHGYKYLFRATGYFEHAHNIFFQMIAEYGIAGLIFLLVVFTDIVRRIRLVEDEDKKVVFIAAFSFYIVAGFSENILFVDMRQFHECMVFYLFYGYLINETKRLNYGFGYDNE